MQFGLGVEELRQQAASMLSWYAMAGVEVATATTPVDYFAFKPETHKKILPNTIPISAPQKMLYQSPSAGGAEQAKAIAAKASSIAELQQAIRHFELCALKKTANHTLLGVGNIEAKILIIGDAPSKEDDANGVAFSDANGELLQKMMAAIGLKLVDDCYALNLSPWRIPASRFIANDEVALCAPFLHRHIELMQPNIIISLGAIPANALLAKNISINNLRSEPNLYGNVSICTIFHPNVLLKNPSFKRNAWHDLLQIKQHFLT